MRFIITAQASADNDAPDAAGGVDVKATAETAESSPSRVPVSQC